jgi:hypothetical protein
LSKLSLLEDRELNLGWFSYVHIRGVDRELGGERLPTKALATAVVGST